MNQPIGTVTFLFTDIEGSSRLWERYPDAMSQSLARHDEILRSAIEAVGGLVFKTIGDAFCAAFHTASDGVQAAVSAQQALYNEPWGDTGRLKVRMALHTGTAEYRDGDYFGNPLNRVARILSAAHGGQVLVSFPVEELVRDALPDGVGLLDLGERRLRDLERPERLFQILIEGLPAEFPPLRSVEVMPNNLPVNLSSFIGRERDLAAIGKLLGESRLVTLTGTGGTGKTRAALQVGSAMLTNFPGGCWFIELAPVSDPARVPESLAVALDIREEPGTPLPVTLRRTLGHRNLLIILDNCEHLQSACGDLVSDILQHCKEIRFLATSRHALGIAGETTYAIPPLAVINPSRDLFQVRDPIQTISQYESVRLFIERAISVKPDFAVTRQNVPAIAQICWRLDGIPLAIELAAARARVLSPEQIASRLDDRFRLLTGSNRSVLPHQQTLRTLIDWSYDLLSESERVLLRRLGAFGGGRTLDAIEAVCTGDGVDAFDALDLLQQLVEKSLLTVEDGPDGEQRYTMLESVWQYARERLKTSGEYEVLRNRHLEYFVIQARLAEPGFDGPDVVSWVERTDADRINYRLAMEWALADPSRVSEGLKIGGALTGFWEIRGYIKEAKHFLDQLVNASAALPTSREKADCISGAARIAWVNNETENATTLYREAIDLYNEIGESGLAAVNRGFLAFNFRNAGRGEESRALFEEVYKEGVRLGDRKVLGIAMNGRASGYDDLGRIEESRKTREECLKIFREHGQRWATGYLLWGLARACLACGDPCAARRALDEWTDIALELKNRWATPYILMMYSAILLAENEKTAAARALGAAIELKEALGMVFDQFDQKEFDKIDGDLRAAFPGPDLEAAFAAGREMNMLEALDYVRRVGTEC